MKFKSWLLSSVLWLFLLRLGCSSAHYRTFSASLSSLALWLLLAWIYTTEAALESSPETWRKMRLEQTDYYYIVNHVQGGSRELTLKAKALGDWVLQTVTSRHVNDLS